MHNQASRKKKRRLVAAFATFLVAAAMAGCVDVGEQEGEDQDTDPGGSGFEPIERSGSDVQASLAADKEEGWVGEDFTFDASNSTAQDEEIVSWRFEFGDGETIEVTAPDEPIVAYNYTAGGLYSVNLTVETGAADNSSADDGENGTADDDSGAQDNETGAGDDQSPDTATLLVAVHDREEVPETELDTGLGGGTDREEHPFTADDGATNFTVTLDLEASSSLMIDSTEGSVRVLSPDGETIAEDEFSMSDGDEETFTLSGDFNATGDHTLEIELDEGELTYEGFVVVFYGQDDIESEDA